MSVNRGKKARPGSCPKNAKLLLTAFEPFGGRPDNRSLRVLHEIQKRGLALGVAVAELPVDFNTIESALLGNIERFCPERLLMLGESGRDARIYLEQIALNRIGEDLKDNRGKSSSRRQINARGPLAYETSYPYEQLKTMLTASGVPVGDSYHAGLYLCNYAFFFASHLAAQGRVNVPRHVGFVHIPRRMVCGHAISTRVIAKAFWQHQQAVGTL